MTSIYLDNAASTRMHPDVVDAMTSCLGEQYGNPSSIHRRGRLAKKAVGRARRQVASLIRAAPCEIFFTSGGTESNNMALRGFASHALRLRRKCVVITSTVEHEAVLAPCDDLAREGMASVKYVPVDRYGAVDTEALGRILDAAAAACLDCEFHNDDNHNDHNPNEKNKNSDGGTGNGDNCGDAGDDTRTAGSRLGAEHGSQTRILEPAPAAAAAHLGKKQDSAPRQDLSPMILVSIMYGNNEVGTLQPVSEIARMCRRAGATFHTDAVQVVGKMPVNVAEVGADMLSMSSHKIHGPKGVGALYVRQAAGLEPRMLGGGGQEGGMRSGTENVAGIVGFGIACRIADERMDEHLLHTRRLRDMLVSGVTTRIPESGLNGSKTDRIPGNAHFTFLGVNGEDLLIKLDEHGIEASTGSACSVNKQKASHVLGAMGFSHEQISGSLRLTLGAMNTEDDVRRAIDALAEVVAELRAVSPFRSKYAFDAR